MTGDGVNPMSRNACSEPPEFDRLESYNQVSHLFSGLGQLRYSGKEKVLCIDGAADGLIDRRG